MGSLLLRFAQESKENPAIRAFLQVIKDRMDGSLFSATQAGDTDYHKGKYIAYKEIFELPDNILNQEVDTEETAS